MLEDSKPLRGRSREFSSDAEEGSVKDDAEVGEGEDPSYSSAAAAMEGAWVRMDESEGIVQRVHSSGQVPRFWVVGDRWRPLDPRRAVRIEAPGRGSQRAARPSSFL